MEPSFINLELVTTFIDTLKSPYHEFLIGNSTINFVDMITIREWIEKGKKDKNIIKGLVKITHPRKASSVGKKKQEKIHAIS